MKHVVVAITPKQAALLRIMLTDYMSNTVSPSVRLDCERIRIRLNRADHTIKERK